MNITVIWKNKQISHLNLTKLLCQKHWNWVLMFRRILYLSHTTVNIFYQKEYFLLIYEIQVSFWTAGFVMLDFNVISTSWEDASFSCDFLLYLRNLIKYSNESLIFKRKAEDLMHKLKNKLHREIVSLHPWRYSGDVWTWSWATCSRWLCLRMGSRPADFHRSLLSSVVLYVYILTYLHWVWFCFLKVCYFEGGR